MPSAASDTKPNYKQLQQIGLFLLFVSCLFSPDECPEERSSTLGRCQLLTFFSSCHLSLLTCCLRILQWCLYLQAVGHVPGRKGKGRRALSFYLGKEALPGEFLHFVSQNWVTRLYAEAKGNEMVMTGLDL